ncbi:MAG: glycerophosphodiester phosphodiesterase [Candidatus Dependentiae bacterium]|nr:glycerophosphodiester phosphodiesterase [Candidatus Dependentiae bacterium]
MAAPVQIIGHRGASAEAPENTRVAFLRAWEQGADAVECDVYLTKDKKIMVMHDASVKRTGGVDLRMADTSSTILSQIDVGSWKGPVYKGQTIPFLKRVVALIPAGRQLFIEVKSGPDMLPYLEELIRESGKADQVRIISFNLEVVAGAKRRMPDIPAYLVVETWSEATIADAERADLDGIDAYYRIVTREWAEAVRNRGMKLYVWTVDDVADAERMRAVGVDGITTNRPKLLLAHFKAQSDAR